MNTKKVFNIAVIAHVDHGKSTFCDAIINICENITRKHSGQSIIDEHTIEQQRGVTIQNHYKELTYKGHTINLIDTPGHYDFKQYVNIGIHIAQNIILLIDITKGIQAQTIKYLEYAQKLKKNIIVVLNKVDIQLDAIYKMNMKFEIKKKWNVDTIYEISAKCQTNVETLLSTIIETGEYINFNSDKHSIDSIPYFTVLNTIITEYNQTIITAKMHDGIIKVGSILTIYKKQYRIIKIINHKYKKQEVQYTEIEKIYDMIIMGNINNKLQHIINLTGKEYKNNDFHEKIIPYTISYYCQIKSIKPEQHHVLYKQINNITMGEQMSSIEIVPHPIYTQVIQLGFYGLFHKEIFFDKLKLNKINFIEIKFHHEYRTRDNKKIFIVDHKALQINYKKYLSNIIAPFMYITIHCPNIYYNSLMSTKDQIAKTNKITNITFTHHNFILNMLLTESDFLSNNFISFIKNISNGHADIIIDDKVYLHTKLSILEVLINKHPIPELTQIIIADKYLEEIENMIIRITQNLSRQQYEILIQVMHNKRILKSQIIKPYRKDVTAKCFGGDSSRRKKLLKKQAQGKTKLLKNFDINKLKSHLLK